MKKRWYLRALALMLVSALAMVTFSAAAEAGSVDDPLVTLSYLNDTYLPKILSQVQERSSGGASSFTVASMTKGQVLTLGVGCEVMLRVGSAVCTAAGSPGLIDETTGGALENGGALVKNHLYMATIEGRGVKATADTVMVMVRGAYSIA